ncbi:MULTISPECIES: hypothetical protein [Bacteria]|uniref:hypothetical protein n=1 Tax=Bacteria TaxID=2 RepID=UPI002FC6E96D
MTDTNKTGNDLASLVQREVTGHPGYPEFAAWCEIQLIHPYPIYFMIWQASREAVAVDVGDMEWVHIDEIIASIEAQGLKVAP